jgi:hypothetical protein
LDFLICRAVYNLPPASLSILCAGENQICRWLHQLRGAVGLPSRYTVWVKNELLDGKLVIVCDAPDVSSAIRQALEQAARNWECGTDILSVYGITEGDVNGGLQ